MGYAWILGAGAPRLLPLEVAAGFWARFRGLMLRRPSPNETALLLPRCASVHTAFMRFALDLAYLDGTGRVLACVRGLRPWRVSRGPAGTAHTLELQAGGLDRFGLAEGCRIADFALDEGSRP